MFSIDIAPLQPGVHHFKRSPSPEDLDVEGDLFSDIEIDLVVDHGDQRILVTIDASATAHLRCDRTLEPYDQTVRGSYALLFADRRVATPGVEDDDSEEPYAEVRELEPTQHVLDLTDVTRDTLKLALPQRRVAPGAEDEDIQTTFGPADADGEGDDVDPRWDKLRELRSSESSDQ